MKSFKKNLTLFFMIVSMVQICAMDTQEPQVPTLHVVLNIERVAKERQARWQRNKNLTDLVMNSDWCKNNVLDMLGGYVGHAQCKKPYYFVSVNRKVAPWILINKQQNAIVKAVKFNDYEGLKKACGLLDAYTSLCISPQASKSSEFIKNYKNKDDFSLLYHSYLSRKIKVTQFLLDRGVNIDSKDFGGWTLLHSSAHLETLDLAKLLLHGGVNINSLNDCNRTPLHLSVMYGRGVELVKLLLAHQADVDAQDHHGKTPLHWGVCFEKLEIVRLLLNHGADTEIKDDQGRTPDQAAWNQEIKDLIAQARIDRAQQIIAEDNIVNETASCCTIS